MKNNFDHIAPVYDTLASIVFGNTLQQAQCAYLDRISPDAKVLIIGGGNGYILRQLLSVKPGVVVDYVEASQQMLKRSGSKIPPGASVNFVHGTEGNIPGNVYDCIITNFFLDVFSLTELRRVVFLLKGKLASNGQWLCTDFQSTNRWNHRALLWLMHRFFGMVSSLEAKELQNIDGSLQESGLTKQEQYFWKNGLVFSALYRHQQA